MNLPLISVIITAYNKAHTIERTIKSLFDQSYENVEIIIIDDASIDETPMICQQYSDRVTYIRNEQNVGLYNSRLHGIEYARGNYVTYIDADDWINKSSISLCVKTALERKADIVQMKIKRVSTRLNIAWAINCKYDVSSPIIGCLYNEKIFPVSCCTKLYRRELLQSADFPEFKQFWGEDRIFNLAVLAKKPKVSLAHDAVYYYRWGGESINTFDKTVLQQYKDVYTLKCNWALTHGFGNYIPNIKQELIKLLNYYVRRLIDSKHFSDEDILFNLKEELESGFWEGIETESYARLFYRNKRMLSRYVKRIVRKLL